MATAMASLLTGRLVRDDVAMTGEITLRGQVLPVGGIKEKVLAAHRVGLKTVILPKRNEKDLEDVPEEVRDSMKFVLADCVEQVFEAALRPTKDQPPRVTRRAQRQARPSHADHEQAERLPCPKYLIVEDDLPMTRLLQTLLSLEGFDAVCHAAPGRGVEHGPAGEAESGGDGFAPGPGQDAGHPERAQDATRRSRPSRSSSSPGWRRKKIACAPARMRSCSSRTARTSCSK